MGKQLAKVEDLPLEYGPLVPLRTETVFTHYPIHRLEKHPDGTILEIRANSESEKGKSFIRWKVSYNVEYGEPGPLAYKIDTLIVNRRIDDAREQGQVPALIRLGSLSEIAREVGTGDNNTAAVKRALFQNAFAAIVTKQSYIARDGTKTEIEFAGTRYALIFAGQVMPDGRKADAVYIRLQEDFRDLLNSVRTRPLDYDHLKHLAPGPQRLYELLSFEIYAALRRQNGRAKLVYSEYCTHAPQKRYFQGNRMRAQMRVLHAPHIAAGYIVDDVEFIETVDSDGLIDWNILYTPGRKAMVEYVQFNSKGNRYIEGHKTERLPVKQEKPAIPSVPQQQQLSLSEPEVEPAPDPEREVLKAEMVKYGVAPLRAQELVREQAPDAIRRALQLFQHKKQKGEKIRASGALLADMVANPGKYVPPEDMPDPIKDAARKEAKKAALAAEEQRITQITERIRTFYARMQNEEPEAFNNFQQHIQDEREKFMNKPMFKGRSSNLQKLMLGTYDQEKGRLKLFLAYFGDQDCPLRELMAFIGSTPEADIKRGLDRIPEK